MKKLFLIFNDFSNKMKEDNLNAYASSCAFFMFLSLVPMFILIITIIPFTPIDYSMITGWVSTELPGGIGDFINSIIGEIYAKSYGTISIAAIATLWSAGKGVSALITGFNAIDDYADKRNWIILRAISCLYTLVFLVSIIAVLLFVVYGNIASDLVLQHVPKFTKVFHGLIRFRTLIAIPVATLIFMLCYALLPYKKHKFSEQLPGAFFSALGWIGFSYFFSLYVNHFNAFGMYGSLTTIIILLMWLYVCMYIVLIGANLNRYFSPIIKVLKPSNLEKIHEKSQKESLEED